MTALYLRHWTSRCCCWYQTEKTITSNLLKPPMKAFARSRTPNPFEVTNFTLLEQPSVALTLAGLCFRRFYRRKAMSPTIWPLLRRYLQTPFSSKRVLPWGRCTYSTFKLTLNGRLDCLTIYRTTNLAARDRIKLPSSVLETDVISIYDQAVFGGRWKNRTLSFNTGMTFKATLYPVRHLPSCCYHGRTWTCNLIRERLLCHTLSYIVTD